MAQHAQDQHLVDRYLDGGADPLGLEAVFSEYFRDVMLEYEKHSNVADTPMEVHLDRNQRGKFASYILRGMATRQDLTLDSGVILYLFRFVALLMICASCFVDGDTLCWRRDEDGQGILCARTTMRMVTTMGVPAEQVKQFRRNLMKSRHLVGVCLL